jgi:hypothetical protein
MSISREILQRVLPLSNTVRCVAFVSLLGLIFPLSVSAQEEAVLELGPLVRHGISFLPANVVKHFYGEYAYESTVIEIYLTSARIPVSTEWEQSGCADGAYKVVPVEVDRTVLYYGGLEGYHLFVSFAADLGDVCRFAGEFLRRFQYFVNLTRTLEPPPLPAILSIDD